MGLVWENSIVTNESFVAQVRPLLVGKTLDGQYPITISDIRLIDTGDLTELDVSLTVSRRLKRKSISTNLRVLADESWRRLSELESPEDYARYVRAQIVRDFEMPPDEKDLLRAEKFREAAQRKLGHTSLARARLLSELRSTFEDVSELDDGGILVEPDDGAWFEVHVSAAQWREYVTEVEVRERLAGRRKVDDGFELAWVEFMRIVKERVEGEDYIVFFRGRLYSSIRIELPPVAVPREL